MKIKCKYCSEFFGPSSEALELISEGYITSDSCDICEDCFDLMEHPEFDFAEMYSDADPGL